MNQDFQAAEAPKNLAPRPQKNIGGIITAAIVVFLIFVSGILFWKNSINETPKENVNLNGSLPKQNNFVVYFGNSELNPESADCGAVFPAQRTLENEEVRPEIVLDELFSGPTGLEAETGYYSFFSATTVDILISVNVAGGTAYVNLKDVRALIPNASSSCGSAELLAEIENTLRQFSEISKVVLGIEGKSQTFYEWLQLDCEGCDDSNFLVAEAACKNFCGDGVCQEIVCLAVGCPCAETAESCADDCKK